MMSLLKEKLMEPKLVSGPFLFRCCVFHRVLKSVTGSGDGRQGSGRVERGERERLTP